MRDEAQIVVLAEWAARVNAETRAAMGVVLGPELGEYSPPPDKFHRLRRWAQEYLSDLMDDTEAAACAAADVEYVRALRDPASWAEGLWSDPGWRDAAHEYHRDRAGRTLIDEEGER